MALRTLACAPCAADVIGAGGAQMVCHPLLQRSEVHSGEGQSVADQSVLNSVGLRLGMRDSP
eukprot:6257977-Alexandrium_andersonii.AAC.1